MLANALVALVICIACAHALWQLMPTIWRLPVAARLAQHVTANGGGNGAGWRGFLLRALRAPSAGCGDCGGKARCPAQVPPPTRVSAHGDPRLIVRSQG